MTDPVRSQVLALRDGRRSGVAEFGDPAGATGFYFHGHPGSRLEAEFAHEAARDAGVRIVALDRPGYGLSDFQPQRTLLDWPRDVGEVADLLGIGEFTVAGSSGGGPYALACAHELSERVDRAVVVSGVGPYDAPGVTQRMRWQNRVGFQLGAKLPPLAGFLMWSMARQVRRRPERALDAIARAMSPVDAAVVSDSDVRRMLTADLTEAFRQGSRGAAHDIVVLGRPWGFSLASIRPEVLLWQGELDALVPPAMGRHLAAQIPNCHATFVPGEGHLLFVRHMAEIVRAVVAR